MIFIVINSVYSIIQWKGKITERLGKLLQAITSEANQDYRQSEWFVYWKDFLSQLRFCNQIVWWLCFRKECAKSIPTWLINSCMLLQQKQNLGPNSLESDTSQFNQLVNHYHHLPEISLFWTLSLPIVHPLFQLTLHYYKSSLLHSLFSSLSSNVDPA